MDSSDATSRASLGFIGLGAMGGPMALNLVHAGYTLVAYDIDRNRLASFARAGASAAQSIRELVQASDVVFTSLPTAASFVAVAEEEMLPRARSGQVFVDLGTAMPADVRRLAEAFAERGAALLDAPVSGGTAGAAAGELRMFVGGDEETCSRIRPILEVLGDPDAIVYCGESGRGQQVKFVNQMAMGLSAAAHLESVALGVAAGIAPSLLAEALGGASGWRAQFDGIARDIDAGRGNEIGVKYGQFHHFLGEARQHGLRLPITEALHAFCAEGEELVVEANRPSPSFWHELTKGGRS